VKLTMAIEPLTRNHVYHLEISDVEFVLMRLDNFDTLLLKECEGSDSIADKLLALETLARRIEEERERQAKEAVR
jgi:hypothetical protein